MDFPWFRMGVLAVMLLGAGGWYHHNVLAPQKQIGELNEKLGKKDTRITELEGEIKSLKANVADKDTTIQTCEFNTQKANDAVSRISARCTQFFADLSAKLAEEDEREPAVEIEGHGPDAMNKFYRELYANE